MGSDLSQSDLVRYGRQLDLPGLGPEGQARLARSTVLVAGLGGLGSAAAFYLAAAGVGRLRFVDRDVVELSNLNRQILHGTADIGRAKTDSAAETIARFNPACAVETFAATITAASAPGLIGRSEVIVDATDNLETRKILNRTALALCTPLVFGGVSGLGGMASTFVPGETGCLECLFPAPPSEDPAPSVLGPLPGMVGAIQALEAVKILLGWPGQLKNRLLVIRAATMTFKTTSLERNPACAACAGAPQ